MFMGLSLVLISAHSDVKYLYEPIIGFCAKTPTECLTFEPADGKESFLCFRLKSQTVIHFKFPWNNSVICLVKIICVIFVGTNNTTRDKTTQENIRWDKLK